MSAPTPLLRHLVVWIAAPVAEIYLSLNSLIRHEIWQYALELIAFAALGVLQWKFAKPKWLRSLLWPALVVLIAGLAANGPLDGQIWIFFYVTGVVLLTLNLMKDFQNSLQPNAFPAALIAIMSVVCLRYLDLTANAEEQDKATHHQTLSAGERLIDDLSFNLSGIDDDYIDETPIIIISIDALRADSSKTMSSWDRLASRGAWWEHTMSSSSWTLPAVASLITGSMPGDHGAGCRFGDGRV